MRGRAETGWRVADRKSWWFTTMPIETPETVGSLGRCALSVVAGISPSQHAVHRLQLLPAYIDHDMAGYQTPEAAAMAGFPPEYCRVVASEANGDCAYVL